MTYEEAEEIIDNYINLSDISCSCHISAPCGKCENLPCEEQVKQAEKILENENGRT